MLSDPLKSPQATREPGTIGSPAPGPPVSAAAPADLRVQLGPQRLHIRWQDGTQSELPLALLRRHCPCAACRTEREAQSATALPVLKKDPSADIRVTGAQLVGRYALQLTWSDGHDTGIFPFTLLRTLCER